MKSSLLFSSFVIFISGFGVFLLRGLCFVVGFSSGGACVKVLFFY